MSINLKSDAKISVAKVYSLKFKEKTLIDQKFDKLHAQKRMQYFFQSIDHEYFVFVTWRTMLKSNQNSVKKDRIIVDIRVFNKITKTDTYFMSLQSDIISTIAKCEFIFTVNATVFFHQWLIKLSDRYKFIVITHRDQKQFNVKIIIFKNISSYVQREIDNILREFKEFCRVYIDDIIIFNKILKKHIEHFHKIFELFDRLHISLSTIKFFLEYFTIQFLNLRVNAFELFTLKEKLKAIIDFKFFETFQNLEIYLKFIEWFREYIFYYAQKAEFLQIKKIMMLRLFSNIKEKFRKLCSKKKFIEIATQTERNFYDQLQKAFSRIFFFFHFDYIRSLYVDINAFKKWNFDAMIYHDKTDEKYSIEEFFKKSNIQFILFLSRLLTNSKRKYWSTELKMTELI